ncbi:MAG TPA: DUF2000 domain-containing protein [Rhabdochlamydiaceae bacterium]
MFANKLVAVMNEKIESGVIMNALAHMCIAFGAEIGEEPLNLANYVDGDGGNHTSSKMPFIILKANSNKIRELRRTALSKGIKFVDFIDTMTGDTYVEQLERTKQTKEENLTYYGIVLMGNWDEVSELTRKFSLWK